MTTYQTVTQALQRAAAKNDPGMRLGALRARLRPTSQVTEVYERHAHTVAQRMAEAFPESKLSYIGSISRGTFNQGYSDLDLLLKLPRDEAIWGDSRVNSNTVLGRVRRELAARYPATGIRRDGQAVVANFGQGRFAADIVPAIFHRMVKPFDDVPARPSFLIPDGSGGWMHTSPDAHNKYIADADDQSGGKLKFVVQMVKFWRDCREPAIPLLSFHLELLIASERLCSGVMSYQRCLREVFSTLRQRACRPLRDPLGISGTIKAASTPAQHLVLMAAVERAALRSNLALALEAKGRLPEACEQWSMLFNRQLPTL